MSIELMSLIWKVPFPTSTQMVIALKLADHAHDDGTKIFPGRASLASRARCSETTVKNTLRLLRESGLLIVVEEGGKGPHDTTKYKMNVGLIKAIADGSVSITGSSDALALSWSDDALEKGANFDPLDFLGGSPRTLRGQPADAKGAAHDPQTIIKHQEPSRASARAGQMAAVSPPEQKRLVLVGDNDWWQWLSIAESKYGVEAAKRFRAEGALVVFDEKPIPAIARTPKLPPPRGSALYSDLVKARERRLGGLTERSKAMSGETGEDAA